jgi:hypothetical protein
MAAKSMTLITPEFGIEKGSQTTSPPFNKLGRVLYHHRTQVKAVEGVHIRGVTDALRAEGVPVDVMSLSGADPYTSPPSCRLRLKRPD